MLLTLRVVASFLAAAHLLGLVWFGSTNHPAAAGVPIALLLLTLTPEARARVWVLLLAVLLALFSYTVAGLPFLDSSNDAGARFLHLVELGLVCVFVWRTATAIVRTVVP